MLVNTQPNYVYGAAILGSAIVSMMFDFFRPPHFNNSLSDEERALRGVRYFSRILSVAVVVVIVLLALFRPNDWFESAIGLTVLLTLLIITGAILRYWANSTLGYVGMAFSQLCGLWTIIFLANGYDISTLVWLPMISWYVITVLGYRIGLGFTLLNLAGYLVFHNYTVSRLPALYIADAPAIILDPNNFAISFTSFLCISSLIIIIIDANRQRNQSKLAHSEQMRRLYLKQTSMAVIHCDPSGNITEWNPAAKAIFGYDGEEVLGRNAIRFLAVQSAHSRIQTIIKALEQGDASELREINQNRTKSGVLISCEWFNTPIRGEDDKLLGWIFSAVDITERIQKERELKQAKEQAEAATEAKSSFLANMSHEIRTPMNGVIGMTSLLTDTRLDGEQGEYVETIRKSGNALLEIINEILDFSKIESGKLLMEEHPFAVRECVQDALNLFINQVQQKEIVLTHSASNKVPLHVIGDSGRLRQILVNLIGNAVKFTENGTIRVDVELDGMNQDHEVAEIHFAIRDTGIGIPAEKIDTLFESFSQADISTTRKYGGTGLGLTITKRLVEIMNGEIWIESVLGEGSTFHFIVRLPVAEITNHRMPALNGAQLEKIGQIAHQGALKLSILLVEDNQVNQKVALHLLKRMGYSADVAGNGLEAVEALQRQQYDLVFMDVQMPEMDGLEATRSIRNQLPEHHQPRIIAMTAAALQEDKQRTVEAGMDGFVSKPIKVVELEKILRAMNRETAVL